MIKFQRTWSVEPAQDVQVAAKATWIAAWPCMGLGG